MRRGPLIATVVAAIALAACGTDDGEPAASPEPTPTPAPEETVVVTPDDDEDGGDTEQAGSEDVAEMAFTECEADRYRIGYPEAWNTNEPDDLLNACRIFHPDEIEEPEQPRDLDLHYAVTVYVDAIAYEDVRSGQELDEELDRRELTVDGRDAFVREYRSTGDALVPEGERGYTYVVDLDGEILVASTYTLGGTDYERDKEILDRMVTEELSIQE